jgi:hypothetical protein
VSRSKYEPLGKLLMSAAARGEHTVQLRFDQIDSVVGGLPVSARRYREWWANSGQPHSAVWRNAGWKVSAVDQGAGEWVRFEDDALPTVLISTNPAEENGQRARLGAWSAPFAAGEVRTSLTATWREVGSISLDGGGAIAFPELPSVPGAYRMTLAGAPGQVRARVYIGETDSLRRRTSHYRNPGPTQSTNIRMNAALRAHLSSGGVATLAIITNAAVSVSSDDQASISLRLSGKAARRLVENAAIVAICIAGDADIENVD